MESLVFFRFEEGKNSPAVGINHEALDAVPESLLSVIAAERWQKEEGLGSTASNPIAVKINKAPCRDEWNPKLAEWIRSIYGFHKDLGGRPVLKLTGIPKDIELEDALVVLDYLGLAPNDPRSIDLSESRKIIQIRASLFLRYVDEINLATEYIFDNLIHEPHKDSYYVFVNSSHDMDYIKNHNYTGPIPVTQLGRPGDLDKFYEWVQNPRMRRNFVSALEDEGLKARFLSRLEFSGSLQEYVGDYAFESSAHPCVECYNCGQYGHYQSDCPAENDRYKLKYGAIKDDMCWAFTKAGGVEGLKGVLMYVVHIEVPN